MSVLTESTGWRTYLIGTAAALLGFMVSVGAIDQGHSQQILTNLPIGMDAVLAFVSAMMITIRQSIKASGWKVVATAGVMLATALLGVFKDLIHVDAGFLAQLNDFLHAGIPVILSFIGIFFRSALKKAEVGQ